MSKHRVRIQVIKVYDVDVEIDDIVETSDIGEDDKKLIAARIEIAAEAKAEKMQSITIQEEGKLIDVSTDHAEHQYEIEE